MGVWKVTPQCDNIINTIILFVSQWLGIAHYMLWLKGVFQFLVTFYPLFSFLVLFIFYFVYLLFFQSLLITCKYVDYVCDSIKH